MIPQQLVLLTRRIARHTRSQGGKYSFSLRVIFLALALAALAPAPLESAAPPAGTSIGNQASATYTDSSNTPRTATSNVAITIVQQVSSFSITTDGQAKQSAAGGQVFFPHTISNTGNGTDTFTLSVTNATGDNFDLTSLALYADLNGDGLPDNNTAITSSGPLAAGATFKFVAVGTVPGSATAAQTASIVITAAGTATASPAVAAANTDTVTVTANGVVTVTQSLSSNSGAAGSGPYTVTINYNNIGNVTVTNVSLLDVLPSGFVYVTNSARWSVLGSGTALTDASDGAQGTSPDTITYDYGVTVAGRVTAVIARVLPGVSGTVTFTVTIASGQEAGKISNPLTYTYDPGTGTALGPLSANTTEFTVSQSTGVTLSSQTIPSATQGSTVTFTNIVQNTGNGTDSFNIILTNINFPAGTTFALYQSDGNTPLVDVNGDGIPDTGSLGTNQTYNVIVKAVLPTDSSGTGVNYTVSVTAISKSNPTATATASDVLTSVVGNTVDLTNGASGGGGAGPEGPAVVSLTANPNTTTRFSLVITNTSGVADTYNLSSSTNSGFSTTTFPPGWSVVFRDTSEAIITATGVLTAGGHKAVYADVTVPAGQAPGTNDLYFRVVSPTSGASDRIHDALIINTVRSIAVIATHNGQVTPGGFVVFSHTVVNNGNVLEGDGVVSSIALSRSDSLSGWSSALYYDADGDGAIGPSDPIITGLSFVSAGGAGLAAGESVRILVKVYSPSGTPVGTINATTITATTANGTYTTTVPATVTTADNSTVISGDLQLTKEQALDANLDGSPDTAYSIADITSGALPGKAIRYRITVKNNGSTPATSVKVYDTTPAYTVYTSTNPAATTVGSVTTVPGNGSAGPLQFDIGTLNPGQSAVVTFGVIIQQ